jgi:hypothetical protein
MGRYKKGTMRTYNLDKKTGIKDDGDNRWYERGGVES